ncbi:MAG: endonuclease/exonuclease/phosphatase family protein [Bacteroidota bacterium]
MSKPDNIHSEAKAEKKARRMTWISRIVLWLNYFAVASLLLSYLAPYVSPADFWPIAFFGLAYPYLLLLNALFVIYWLLRWRIQIILPLIAILIGINRFPSVLNFHFGEEKPGSGSFGVMSWNVRLFDLYNWSKNKETRNKMFSFLRSENPAVLCLQEFFHGEEGYFPTLDTLQQMLAAKNVYYQYTLTLRGYQHFGIATFSSFPMVNKGEIRFETRTNNICIYTDLLVNSDTIRVYNMHLQSIQMGYADYKFVEDLESNKEVDEIEGSKNLLRRLKRAFVRRAPQAEMVAEHIRKCRYPVIVCGDFNDTPFSYTYNTVKGNLNDAFIECGNGFGKTYNGIFPSFRIDYILHSGSLLPSGYYTYSESYSDHFPVSCFFELKKP